MSVSGGHLQGGAHEKLMIRPIDRVERHYLSAGSVTCSIPFYCAIDTFHRDIVK